MDIWVAKILVEEIDLNSCSVELFKTEKEAIEYADNEIDSYASDFNGNVMERSEHYYTMEAGDEYVTIEIEKHTL